MVLQIYPFERSVCGKQRGKSSERDSATSHFSTPVSFLQISCIMTLELLDFGLIIVYEYLSFNCKSRLGLSNHLSAVAAYMHCAMLVVLE